MAALPEGFVIRGAQAPAGLPEGFVIRGNQAPSSPAGSSFGQVGDIFNKRANELADNVVAYKTGDITFPELSSDFIGKSMFGTANDLAGAAVSAVIPDAVKRGVSSGAQTVANAIDSNGVGQFIGDKLMGARDAYESLNPRVKAQIENTANIVGLLPSAKGSQLANEALAPVKSATGNALNYAGDALYNSGKASFDAKRTGFLQDLITPKETPTVRADQFSRSTEKGLLRKAVVEPTPQELDIINTLTPLDVNGRKSLLANYNVISEANTKEATDLIGKLQANNVAIPLNQLNATFDNLMANLSKNPWLVGDGEKSAQRVIDGFKDILIKNDDFTASGMLQARKDFDQWVKNQKGTGFFESADSPAKLAVQQTRQAINDLVEANVPNVGYKASLKKQSNLYRAMDNIESKGGFQGKNMVTRAIDKAGNYIPLKSGIMKSAVVLGGAGAAAAAPIFTATGLAGYGAYKGLTSPALRKGAGQALKATGKAIKP